MHFPKIIAFCKLPIPMISFFIMRYRVQLPNHSTILFYNAVTRYEGSTMAQLGLIIHMQISCFVLNVMLNQLILIPISKLIQRFYRASL